MNSKNKLFRDAFKARWKLDSAVVDKHFDNLCKFAEDVQGKIGQNISVITPSGVLHFENRPIDFTFTFERVKGKKGKKK